MTSSSTNVVFLFICYLSVEPAMAFPIPPSMRHARLSAFSGRASHVTFPIPEWAILCIFVTGGCLSCPISSPDLGRSLTPSPHPQHSSSPSLGRIGCRLSLDRGFRPSSYGSLVRPTIHPVLLDFTDICLGPLGSSAGDGATTLRHAVRRFYLISLPFTTADGAGRAAPRRISTRRGGLAYPISAGPRSRWYQRPSPQVSMV